jgi:hypothetical protein
MPNVRPGTHRGASKPPQLLILPGHPVEAAKTFAYNFSASVRRQTKFVKQKYLHKYRQLEERFLNSSQGEAGLIFAVPDIPAHITSTELVSALNDTLASLCNESRGGDFSGTSLSTNPPHTTDLLDFECEEHPPTPRPPAAASNLDLLLPGLTDSPASVKSHLASLSTDDLLCRHGLDELLLAPLLPISRQDRTSKTREPRRHKPAPSDAFGFLETLVFQDLSPYPLVPNTRPALKRSLVKTKASVLDTNNGNTLLRKQAGNSLRQVSTPIFAEASLVAAPIRRSRRLRRGALNMRRAKLPRPALRPTTAGRYEPSKNASSPYTAYQPGRASLLPLPPPTANSLAEEMAHELDKAVASLTNSLTEEMANELDQAVARLAEEMVDELDRALASLGNATEEENIADKAVLANRPEPLPTAFQPIAPLRISSRPGGKASGTTVSVPPPFQDRLREASRSTIKAAGHEAEISELRWFRCGR